MPAPGRRVIYPPEESVVRTWGMAGGESWHLLGVLRSLSSPAHSCGDAKQGNALLEMWV